MRTLKLEVDENLGFDEAQVLAVTEASKHLKDPMVLGWLNRTTGRHSPDVDCCQAEGKETWEIYTESRGGSIRVEVGSQYVFVLREGLAAD
ncbi:MAG: AF1514 family protein [Dehalococcoidia bacterium]|nr:MAG: AF1514 family protein [Dehalococcoidia bacterium]UCG83180.1 MAG: AF1514 family protein [Dehalococcoidia bacterium]